jgi:iron complex transport system permease protein
MRMSRQQYLTWFLILAVPLSFLFAILHGSTILTWLDVWRALGDQDAGAAKAIIVELRWPRALAAFTVGGLLALAGALLQVLLRNPLADPYILGVSGGAAVATLIAMALGLGGGWLGGGAFAGAMVSMVLVFSLSRTGSTWTQSRLLLTGVVIAAGWGALISLILAATPSGPLQGMLFWLLGDLAYAQQPRLALLILVAGLGLALWLARPLNLLARGETVAAALGEQPFRLRVIVYFLASLLTATAVTLAGTVGFVGLIVPHILRLLAGADHRYLLPNAVLLGGCFLLIADTLARSLLAPTQLPVGVLTALLGVPIFLYLLAHTSIPSPVPDESTPAGRSR